jgi:hypothetical protein
VSDNPGLPEAVSLPGGSGEIALLTAISAALDAEPGDLPARVELVRRYLGAALDAPTGNRRATFKVIAQLIVRDLSHDPSRRHG